MKRYRTSIICALAVLIAVPAFIRINVAESQAQTQSNLAAFDLETLRESIGNFFENLSDPNKGSEKAIKDFLKNTPLADNEKIKTKFTDDVRLIGQNFGPYVSYEPIGVKTIGSDLVVFRYLYKCQNYPAVWYFTYYRPRAKTADSVASSSWTLIGFRFDTNLDAALLDATFDQRN